MSSREVLKWSRKILTVLRCLKVEIAKSLRNYEIIFYLYDNFVLKYTCTLVNNQNIVINYCDKKKCIIVIKQQLNTNAGLR